MAVSAAKSGTRRMKIRSSSGCATARTVRGKLEQLSLSLSEFRNQQCRFKDKLRHSTTLAIAVNQLSGTSVRSAGLQSLQTSPSCQVSPLSRLVLWTTRLGSILKCTSTATAPSVGRPYPKPVEDSQRWPLSWEYGAARLVGTLRIITRSAECRTIGPRLTSSMSDLIAARDQNGRGGIYEDTPSIATAFGS